MPSNQGNGLVSETYHPFIRSQISVLGALSVEGVKTADVAKAIPGISENRNALKGCNQSPKEGHFVWEGENPLIF